LFFRTHCLNSICLGEAKMGILFLKILVTWWLVGVAAGLVLGAIIRRGERVRTEAFLTYVFGSIEALQTSRS
jgi:hypothetical protein